MVGLHIILPKCRPSVGRSPTGEPYRLETKGRLANLTGEPGGVAGVSKAMSAKPVVPVERIELPTFGLQNRCSTAELNRRTKQIQTLTDRMPLPPF